jgi:hypothetical protein
MSNAHQKDAADSEQNRLIVRTKYKRSPFHYSGTYFTLVWLIALIAVFLYPPVPTGPTIALFIFLILFFYGVGVQQYYFILSEDCLLVRNHWFIWKETTLPWSDITRVSVEKAKASSSSKGIAWEAGIWVGTNEGSFTFRSGPLNVADLEELVHAIEARRKHKHS